MVEPTSGSALPPTAGSLAMAGAGGGVGGTPPGALKEGRQSGSVLPTSLEASGLKKSGWGLLLTGIVGGMLVAVYAVATPFITPALRRICLPFVPATAKQIENVVEMLRSRRGPLVDVGSGDGRIVIAAAKEGFMAAGYELNPWLVWYSRYRAWREGVQDLATFYISDLWKVTFSQYSNVVVFGVPQMVSMHSPVVACEGPSVSNRAPLCGLLRPVQNGGLPEIPRERCISLPCLHKILQGLKSFIIKDSVLF